MKDMKQKDYIKNILSVLLSLALLLSMVPAVAFPAQAASSGTCGTNLTWTLDDEGTLTISGTGAMTNYSSSSSVPWYSSRTSITNVVIDEGVTSIGDRVFNGCTGLTSITIPDSVTSIGARAFYECTGLTSITIPDSVTSIGREAFYGCTGLTGITIPDSVASIVARAFINCTGLTSITIGDSVTSIGGAAFYNCKALTSITIPDRVTSIGEGAFFNCTGLTSITIPDSVTSIGNYAFRGCTGLTSVTIGDGVTSIGSSAFDGCISLTKVTYCGTQTQWNSITIGDDNDDLTSASRQYHDWREATCTAPKTCSVCGATEGDVVHSWVDATCTTPKTCSVCGATEGDVAHNWVAANCTIPKTCSVCKATEGDALGHSWKSATCTTPKTCTVCGVTEGDVVHSWVDATCTVPKTCTVCGATEGEALGHSWVDATCTIPKTCSVCNATEGEALGHNWVAATCTTPEICSACNTIGWAALGHSYVKGVCSVCNDAPERFGSCGEGNSWSIDENGKLTISGTGIMHNEGFTDPVPWTPFKDCITEVVIEQGITDIAGNAFSNCTGLTTVTIPDGVTYIGLGAFSNCTSLTGITIPNSVTKVEMLAFFGCTELTDVYYTGGINQWEEINIGGDNEMLMSATLHCAFVGAGTCGDNLTWILDNEGTLTISGTGAMTDYSYNGGPFQPWGTYRSDVKKVVIEDGVTTVGNWAFAEYSNLTEVDLPDSIVSIGEVAFLNCANLISITIPDSVTSIGGSAFCDCTGLTSVTIPDSVTSIGNYAFSGCKGLEEINFNAAAMEDLSSSNYVFAYAGQNGNGITVNIGANVTRIPAYLFYPYSNYSYAPKIATVNFAEGSVCASIGGSAFSGCTGLTSITIPDSVTSIGTHAFRGCTGLTSITIPESVTSLGSYAFGNCTGLNGVYITDLEAWCNISINGEPPSNPLAVARNLYLNNELVTDLVIPDGVTSISQSAFCGCTSITSVTIPDSVTSIGEYVFDGCTGLTSITIPGGVTRIGQAMFCNTSLTQVFYGGTKNQISIVSDNNEPLMNATWHYEVQKLVVGDEMYCYCPECDKTFSTAGEEIKVGTVKFLDEDGTIISEATCPYGRPITVPADPTKAADKTYTYTFAGWGENFSEICVGDATYTATYTPTYIEYTVEFKDWDGSTLSSKTYHYGDMVDLPAISGRPADEKYTYVFTGWNKTVVDCEGDAVYTARYTPMYINYTVTFLDWNGEVISEKTYHYGDTVTVPADPVRANDGYLTYDFTGWDKEVTATCAGNATYTATYEEKVVLQEALASGGTVKLVKDTQVDYLTIGNGATLDLNGYTLTADYFTSYGTVVDGTDGGNALVKVNKGIHLATENEFMPIYDSANGGYRFYRYELQNLGFKAVDSGTVKAGFRLTFANTSGYDVLSTTTDVALDTVALVSWTGSMGVTHYTFSDDTLRNYAAMAAADIASKGSTSKAMTLTLTGVDSLGENASVQFQPTVETAPGMIAQGADKTWTAQ